jgi:hypothetical protein
VICKQTRNTYKNFELKILTLTRMSRIFQNGTSVRLPDVKSP